MTALVSISSTWPSSRAYQKDNQGNKHYSDGNDRLAHRGQGAACAAVPVPTDVPGSRAQFRRLFHLGFFPSAATDNRLRSRLPGVAIAAFILRAIFPAGGYPAPDRGISQINNLSSYD
jgi:hypothetical protein